MKTPKITSDMVFKNRTKEVIVGTVVSLLSLRKAKPTLVTAELFRRQLPTLGTSLPPRNAAIASKALMTAARGAEPVGMGRAREGSRTQDQRQGPRRPEGGRPAGCRGAALSRLGHPREPAGTQVGGGCRREAAAAGGGADVFRPSEPPHLLGSPSPTPMSTSPAIASSIRTSAPRSQVTRTALSPLACPLSEHMGIHRGLRHRPCPATGRRPRPREQSDSRPRRGSQGCGWSPGGSRPPQGPGATAPPAPDTLNGGHEHCWGGGGSEAAAVWP